jgi:hypothetical protein
LGASIRSTRLRSLKPSFFVRGVPEYPAVEGTGVRPNDEVERRAAALPSIEAA